MSYPKEVLVIHEEFNTASNKLLLQVEEMLSHEVAVIKAEALKRLGFTNASPVTTVTKVKHDYELHKLVKEYEQHYPDYKFIVEEDVIAICKKYGLVFAPVSAYTGFIPASKIDRMVKFRLKQSEHQPLDLIRVLEFWSTASDKEVIAQLKRENPSGIFPVMTSYGDVYACTLNGEKARVEVGEKFSRQGLFICAPKKDMDMTGLQNGKNPLMFFQANMFKSPPPDPVVLKPVKGGYLIIAAWGDEASDPIVVNPKDN